jgi:hypothetical protein
MSLLVSPEQRAREILHGLYPHCARCGTQMERLASRRWFYPWIVSLDGPQSPGRFCSEVCVLATQAERDG